MCPDVACSGSAKVVAYVANEVEGSVLRWLKLTDPFLRSTDLAEGNTEEREKDEKKREQVRGREGQG